MPLDIEITKVNLSTYRVKLSGALDTQTAATLDQRMEPVLADANARTIQLELHDLTFISSIGLGSVAKIKKAMTANRGVMMIIGAQPQIIRVFDIVKMMPKETVFTSRQEADDYLAAIQKQVIDEQRDARQ